jgi:hypothetical protein
LALTQTLQVFVFAQTLPVLSDHPDIAGC